MLKRILVGLGCRARFAVAVVASGLCVLAAPAQAASLTPLFHFDLHYTAAGVVQGTGANVAYLYGSTYDTSQTSGGALFRVPTSGGAPQTLYQLKATDGYSPRTTLLASTDGYLYGTTHNSARTATKTAAGGGTVFRVAQDGTGFTTLYDFAGVTGNPSADDSLVPDFPLIEDGTYLYGVTAGGGTNSTGMVYRIRKSDGAFAVLHNFAALNSDGTSTTGEGYYPSAALLLASDGRLYGVTQHGGSYLVTTSTGTYGAGTIYSLNVDGSSFQTLYAFPALDNTASPAVNAYGANPTGSLVEISPGTLVGTTNVGGTPADTTVSGYGTVFEFDVASLTPTVLYAFDLTTGSTPTGRLAYNATTGLVYGVATSGSSTSSPVTAYGNLFAVNPITVQYTLLYSLATTDGYGVVGGITLGTDGDLYGATQAGGACTETYPYTGYGAVFRYSATTNGSYTSYSNCTPATSSSKGAMQGGWLLLLGMLGLAPPVRRRMFGVASV